MAWTGGCFCGDVRYRAEADPFRVVHCHCGTCRRLSGAAFLTGAGIAIYHVGVEQHWWVSSCTGTLETGLSMKDFRASLSLQEAAVALKRLERSIVLEVRDASRQLINGLKQIDAARAARVLAEKKLEAEIRKFKVSNGAMVWVAGCVKTGG